MYKRLGRPGQQRNAEPHVAQAPHPQAWQFRQQGNLFKRAEQNYAFLCFSLTLFTVRCDIGNEGRGSNAA